MDHFPLFGQMLKPLVEIGLLDGVSYDNQGFQDFPLRAGFGEEEIFEGLFVGDSSLLRHKSSEYASLIQSWFYWGLLNECLQYQVPSSDFLEQAPDASQRLTTANLERHFVSWAQRLEKMDADVSERHIRNAEDTLGRTIFLLRTLSLRMEKACSKDESDLNAQFWRLHGREILPRDLELSIGALGYAIDHTIKVLSSELGLHKSESGIRSAAHWYTPPMLTNLLRIYKFCESDMKYFTDDTYGFITACMAVTIPGLSREGDHSNCKADRCEADNINVNSYKMVHATDSCSCSVFMSQQGWHEMLRIVEEGGIPLVRLKFKSADPHEEPEFEVLPAAPDIKYVAFSHVWADGRGNVTGNGQFKCQWRWLQECAQAHCTNSLNIDDRSLEDTMPFWIDTFCVPKGSDTCVLELRKKSILMMPKIYRSADVVIVLDSAFENASQMSVLELSMRLKFCTWSRRVWTLHEGAVAQEVMIRTADGLVSMTAMHYQMAKAKYPTRDENGWHILRTIEKEYIHALFQSCIMINKFASTAKSTFFFTWKELKTRATSLETDRYLVMGIINQVDEKTLLQLQRSEMDRVDLGAARRAKLKSVLLSSSIIPQGIIFNLDKRFEEPGMQWAPSAIGAEIPDDSSSIFLEKIDGRGAVVKYNGWRISSSLHDVAASHFLLLQPDGAAGHRRSYRLAVWPTDEKRKSFASITAWVDRGSSLAVILSDVPDPSNTYINFQRALLVEDRGKSSVGSDEEAEQPGIIHATYIAVLRVYCDAKNDDSIPEIQAAWVEGGFEQLWCVG